VALLKPGKAPTDASNFRPVSLLCHTYKMFERMILNRIKDKIDGKLIKQQAGFRAGKSCTGLILNLVEEIEKGYENNVITGTAFINLSAAYDTVNHRLLLKKIHKLTEDAKFTKNISLLLRNLLRNGFLYHCRPKRADEEDKIMDYPKEVFYHQFYLIFILMINQLGPKRSTLYTLMTSLLQPRPKYSKKWKFYYCLL
jgi:hypothetical protein